MAADDFPEMYPATTTEFADPVEGDSEEVAAFRPLLARTQLEEKPLKLIYSGEECGWDADMFHRCVDSMGAAVSLITHQKLPAVLRESSRGVDLYWSACENGPMSCYHLQFAYYLK
eukprot:scaffold205402_cov20-Prasinocladus_malaysianus.AAC.1